MNKTICDIIKIKIAPRPVEQKPTERKGAVIISCPGEGPCTVWDLDLRCCLVSGGFEDPCLSDNTPIDQSIIDSSILAASQFLWAATGRQFGTCTVTLRPLCINQCSTDCAGLVESGYGFPWMPVHQMDNSWTNITCTQKNCTCVELCEIPLPYPVCSVDQVVIDGVIVPDTEYFVTDFNKLVRAKSSGCWPDCNDLTLPNIYEGTWSVTVTYGKPVPELVKIAASEFACQLMKRCVGRPCDLPQRIQSINRQGMSATFLDPMEFLKDGMTGIFLVDLAIKTYNPRKLFKRATVVSPDFTQKWAVKTWVSGSPTSPVPPPGGVIDGGGP